MIIIYTDGSAKKNGSSDSSGGYAAIVCECQKNEKPEDYKIIDIYQNFENGTTNNRMEMSAIIWALSNYGDESHRENNLLIPIVYTDSMYCVNSFNNWIIGWKTNGWVKANGKKLENLDLIKRYDQLIQSGYKIDLRYIKGHDGEIWNEMADKLATGKMKSTDIKINKEEEYEQLTLKGWN